MRSIKLIPPVILGLTLQVIVLSAFAQNSTVSVCVKNLLASNIVLCTEKNCGGTCSKQCVPFSETTSAQKVPLNASISVCFANSQCQVAMLAKNFNAPAKAGGSQLYLAQDADYSLTVSPAPVGCP